MFQKPRCQKHAKVQRQVKFCKIFILCAIEKGKKNLEKNNSSMKKQAKSETGKQAVQLTEKEIQVA